MRSTDHRGFTLMESLLALGVFALSVSVVLSFFVKSMRRMSDVDAYARATALVSLLRAELGEINSDEFAGMLDTSKHSVVLYFADMDANRLYQEDDVGNHSFYVVEVDRIEQPVRGDVAIEHGDVSVLSVCVSWPYHVSGFIKTGEVVSGIGGQFEFLVTLKE